MGLPGRAFCAVLPVFVRVAPGFGPTSASVTDTLEIFAMKHDVLVGPPWPLFEYGQPASRLGTCCFCSSGLPFGVYDTVRERVSKCMWVFARDYGTCAKLPCVEPLESTPINGATADVLAHARR